MHVALIVVNHDLLNLLKGNILLTIYIHMNV